MQPHSHKRLDAAYYISRVLIPPLERVFNLVGADVRSWFDDMPKSLRADQPDMSVINPESDVWQHVKVLLISRKLLQNDA